MDFKFTQLLLQFSDCEINFTGQNVFFGLLLIFMEKWSHPFCDVEAVGN